MELVGFGLEWVFGWSGLAGLVVPCINLPWPALPFLALPCLLPVLRACRWLACDLPVTCHMACHVACLMACLIPCFMAWPHCLLTVWDYDLSRGLCHAFSGLRCDRPLRLASWRVSWLVLGLPSCLFHVLRHGVLDGLPYSFISWLAHACLSKAVMTRAIENEIRHP